MRVFVSSTYEDLALHRGKVEDSLAMSGIAYNAMEHFAASSSPTIHTCLQAVGASNVFVGILGVRYGSSPPGCQLSYTEREYKHARSLKIPIMMFLIDMRKASVNPDVIASETHEQHQRLDQFKGFVRKHHTVTFFTTPEDLARLVLASIIREFGVTI